MAWGDQIDPREPWRQRVEATKDDEPVPGAGARGPSRRLRRDPILAAKAEVRASLWLWSLLLAVSGIVGIVGIATDDRTPTLELASGIVGAVIILGFALAHWATLAPLLRTSGLTAKTWWLVPVALFELWFFMTAYLGVFRLLGAQTISLLTPYRDSEWSYWIAFAAVAVVPPIVEEIAFRGVIFGCLSRVMSVRDATIVQAAMFSVLHFLPSIFVSHFVMGLVFGYLRHKTKSLWPGIFVHALWNAYCLTIE